MKYFDLKPAFDAYKAGENIAHTLRELTGSDGNSPEIIEIAYDLQVGSSIDFVTDQKEAWTAYATELSEILRQHVTPGDRILDAGTGELTTLAGVAPLCFSSVSEIYACDISWSRLYRGRKFFQSMVEMPFAKKLQSLVSDLFRLPFGDGAVDLVWTAHALEPNGGREKEALSELLRVARRKLVLFEPSYEQNTPQGQERMDIHGYIKGLPDAIQILGGHCEEIIKIASAINPLNPTYAYIITPPDKPLGSSFWACPSTRLPMARLDDCFWSDRSLLAYPILKGIPILRRDSAILASGLR